MRLLSIIRKKSLTVQNETDIIAFTHRKRSYVTDPTISLLSNFLRSIHPFEGTSLTEALRIHVIAVLR